jgi:hypothetical protein
MWASFNEDGHPEERRTRKPRTPTYPIRARQDWAFARHSQKCLVLTRCVRIGAASLASDASAFACNYEPGGAISTMATTRYRVVVFGREGESRRVRLGGTAPIEA